MNPDRFKLTHFSEGHWQLRIGRRFRVTWLRGDGLMFWHPYKPRPSFSVGLKGFYGFRKYDRIVKKLHRPLDNA